MRKEEKEHSAGEQLKKSVTFLEALALVVGMIIGSGIFLKPGVVLDSRRIVDEPVTVAKVLGLDMGDVDGHAIDEILR